MLCWLSSAVGSAITRASDRGSAGRLGHTSSKDPVYVRHAVVNNSRFGAELAQAQRNGLHGVHGGMDGNGLFRGCACRSIASGGGAVGRAAMLPGAEAACHGVTDVSRSSVLGVDFSPTLASLEVNDTGLAGGTRGRRQQRVMRSVDHHPRKRAGVREAWVDTPDGS